MWLKSEYHIHYFESHWKLKRNIFINWNILDVKCCWGLLYKRCNSIGYACKKLSTQLEKVWYTFSDAVVVSWKNRSTLVTICSLFINSLFIFILMFYVLETFGVRRKAAIILLRSLWQNCSKLAVLARNCQAVKVNGNTWDLWPYLFWN